MIENIVQPQISTNDLPPSIEAPQRAQATIHWPGGITQCDGITVRPIEGGPIRSGPRLIFSTPVVLQKGHAMPAEGRSVTISEQGVLIKLHDPMPLSQHDSVWIKYPLLEKKLGTPSAPVTYRVVRIEKHADYRLIALQSLDAPSLFQERLRQFIEQHKFRYKLDVADQVECLYTQALSQLHIKYHPVLVCLQDEGAQRKALLTNAVNAMPPWRVPNLACLFEHAPNMPTPYRLIVSPHQSLLSSETVETACEALHEISVRLASQTRKKWLGWQSMQIALPSPQSESQSHLPEKAHAQCELIRLDRQHRRAYRRYAVELVVDLTVRGLRYRGQSIDVSVDGIRLRFNEPITADIGDTVRVDFPRLQKRFKKYTLTDQPYRVAAISKDRMMLSLTRDHRYFEHGAARFFEDALPHSAERLEVLPDHTLWEAEAEMAGKILGGHLPAWILFFHFRSHQWQLTDLAYTGSSKAWFSMFSDQQDITLNWLQNAWTRKLSTCDEFSGVTDDLFVFNNDGDWSAYWRTDDERPRNQRPTRIFRAYFVPTPKQNLQPWRQRALPIRTHSYRMYSQLLNRIRAIGAIGYLFDISEAVSERDDAALTQTPRDSV
ncbi:MAG: PilZ domain-containing protein [Gammaproteobacteria bacterium]|nr:MAG: PilZ domain-containing protein [Gammaproteobacteria bacterium]